jgi:hypothetical protein
MHAADLGKTCSLSTLLVKTGEVKVWRWWVGRITQRFGDKSESMRSKSMRNTRGLGGEKIKVAE